MSSLAHLAGQAAHDPTSGSLLLPRLGLVATATLGCEGGRGREACTQEAREVAEPLPPQLPSRSAEARSGGGGGFSEGVTWERGLEG